MLQIKKVGTKLGKFCIHVPQEDEKFQVVKASKNSYTVVLKTLHTGSK